jgi:hypothetical protein
MSHTLIRTSTRSALAVAAAASLLGGSAATAYAAPPDQARGELTFETTYGPGELCDVAVHELIQGTFHDITFADGSTTSHVRVVFTYTNEETGAPATDSGSFTVRQVGDTLVLNGLTVRLRGPDGKLRGIDAGRLILDAETFEVISRSGHELGDYDVAVCAALGAEPAD